MPRPWRSLRWDPAVLVVTPATAELEPAGEQQLTAEITTGADRTYNGTQGGVSYESSDEDVSTVDAVGLVTAVADGECTITATVTQYPTVTDTVAVTVETP